MGSKDRALLKDVFRPFLPLISVYKKNNMNKEQHYTLTQLIGGNNHKTFKAAMRDLGVLQFDLSPNLSEYPKHFSSYKRVNGDTNYKYSKTIIAWVFKQKPELLVKFPIWSEQHA